MKQDNSTSVPPFNIYNKNGPPDPNTEFFHNPYRAPIKPLYDHKISASNNQDLKRVVPPQ